MAIKVVYRPLKYIAWTSLFMFIIYTLYPFINGMGCDFTSETVVKKTTLYSTCKFGMVRTFAINNINNATIIHTGLFGISGDTVFFISLDANDITYNSIAPPPSHLSIIRKNKTLFIGKIITSENYDLIILLSPFPYLHKIKRVGQLSYI
jgi:hypothetical protein